jgi:hypothetical protein
MELDWSMASPDEIMAGSSIVRRKALAELAAPV